MENSIKNKFSLLLLLLVVCAFSNRAAGQILQDSTVTDHGTIYNNPTVKAEFPGGTSAFFKYIMQNFRVPEKMTKGKIIAQFVVDTDGSLTQIKILQDLGDGTGKEAQRVLRRSPKWKPGEYNGKIVKTVFSFPIQFN